MLIYFKKEKIPQLDIIKIKLKNITIANSQESKHIKTNLKKKSINKKKSKKAKWQKKSGEVNKTHEREVMRIR
jgi:hypothetical protein